MGEPVPQTYKRHFDFPFWPVESTSELADYAEWLIALVGDESGVEPEVRLVITLLGRERDSPLSLGEFRERFDEFPFDKIFAVSIDAWSPDESLTLELRMTTGMLSSKAATVTVAGHGKPQVQRTKTKVREEGEARIAGMQEARSKAAAGIGDVAGEIFRAEAKRERDRERATPRTQPSPAEDQPAPKPRQAERVESERAPLWRRILGNQYTIQIVGGLIAALIAGLILAELFSEP